MSEISDRQLLRTVSRAAFGQAYRLELMLAVADATDGICTLTDLTKTLDVTMSSLQAPFRSLVSLGLLTPLPLTESRYRHYLRSDSSAWQWARELAASASRQACDSSTLSS